METPKNQLQPNTTQVPNLVFDEWLPHLKDTELRVLLIVIRQTLGWVDTDGTGRKERDWISQYQLQQKTGKKERAVREAIATLVDKLGIIEALTEQGEALNTPTKRLNHGNRVYYRLNLRNRQKELFTDPGPRQKGRGLTKAIADHKNRTQVNTPAKKEGGKKDALQKKPFLQKEIQAKAGKPDQTTFKEKSQDSVPHETHTSNRTSQDSKPPLPTIRLISCFKRYAEEIRHETPQFERGKDGNLIKAALRHLREDQLELHMLWFLESRRKMSTTIGAALCKESIQGFIDATRTEQGFYLRMSDTWKQYNKTQAPDPYGTAGKLALLKQQLAERLAR